jgi:hypothetical protein
VTLLAALAGVVAGATAQAAGSPVASLAWALLAGVGLSLMLRGGGLRVLGVLLTVLATASAGWAVQARVWPSAAGFAVVALASVGITVAGPRWAGRSRAAVDRPRDLWQSMDAGEDPTAEHGVPR